jgi:thiol-disulfide isomerase/thioredoxin
MNIWTTKPGGNVDERWNPRTRLFPFKRSMLKVSMRRLTTALMLAALPAIAPINALANESVAPATQCAPTPMARTQSEIIQDLNAASLELAGVAPSPTSILDAGQRKVVAPKMIPLLKRMLVDVREFGTLNPDAQSQVAQTENQFQTTLALLGDPETLDALKALSASKTPATAAQARCSLLLVRWIQANKDATLQAGILSDLQKTARANPTDENVLGLVALVVQEGAATPSLKEQALKILTDDVKDPSAAEVIQKVQETASLNSLESTPLTLAGPLVDGKPFTTADWKGKVILVDFWASWCPPCRAELPRVQAVYSQYHNKGLEVLGVSCDNSAAELQSFLADNKEIVWPQMFDASHAGWHPLATQFGITSIPTMFLIDKKGIVRTVDARQNFEELIPKMLNES